MENVEALLELNRIHVEKFKMDPKEKLRPILRELKNIKMAVDNGGQQQEQLRQRIEAAEKEAEEIKDNLPKLIATITKGKERMAVVKGMTLKEMLSVQQAVAKAEENVQQGKEKIDLLQFDRVQYLSELHQADAAIAELKLQYNEKVKIYQKEKEKIELQYAALLSQEETLKEGLDPKILHVFNEAAKVVPASPVAILRNGYCSGCRVGVSCHKARLVAQGEVLQRCDNCNRLLLPASAMGSPAE